MASGFGLMPCSQGQALSPVGAELAREEALEAAKSFAAVRRSDKHRSRNVFKCLLVLGSAEILGQATQAGRQVIRGGRRHILPADLALGVQALVPAARVQEVLLQGRQLVL